MTQAEAPEAKKATTVLIASGDGIFESFWQFSMIGRIV
jgi:hypothetical protein